MLVYLITHAHTTQEAAVDATHWGLSTRGRAQAEALAALPWWAEVAGVAVSREPKALLTAQPALDARGGRLPVLVEPRLDELVRPGWVEDYASRVAACFARPQESAGGWEPAATALGRVAAALDELAAAHPGSDPWAVVGHGLTLSLYRAWLLGRPRAVFEEWRQLDFAAVAQVELEVGRGPGPPARRLLADFTPVLAGPGRG